MVKSGVWKAAAAVAAVCVCGAAVVALKPDAKTAAGRQEETSGYTADALADEQDAADVIGDTASVFSDIDAGTAADHSADETNENRSSAKEQQYEKLLTEYSEQLEEIYQYCLNGEFELVHSRLEDGTYEQLMEDIHNEWSNQYEFGESGLSYPSDDGEACIKLYNRVSIPDFHASSPGPYLYYGPLKDGSREGYGHWLQATGEYYHFEGNWQDDKPNGEGKLVIQNVEWLRIEREGSYLNGLEHGSMCEQDIYPDRTETFYFESIEGKRQPNALNWNDEPCIENDGGVVMDNHGLGGINSYCGVEGFFSWIK